MNRIAVDVVILPDEAMTEKAIEANTGLIKQAGERIVLNKESCLPHISLAMGSVGENDIKAVEQVLAGIAERTTIGQLKAIGVQTSTNSVGEAVSVFEVENTPGLQLLHEEVMNRLTRFLSSDVTADMLYNPDEVGRSTLLWIKNYRENSSFENFFPHITIGYGELKDLSFPIEFTPRQLALCHLGSHCTCRTVLCSVSIVTQR